MVEDPAVEEEEDEDREAELAAAAAALAEAEEVRRPQDGRRRLVGRPLRRRRTRA